MMSRSMCGVETSFLGVFFVVIFFFYIPDNIYRYQLRNGGERDGEKGKSKKWLTAFFAYGLL